MTGPALWTLAEAQRRLQRRELSSVELTQAVLDRIVDLDNDIRAYLTLLPEAALAQAEAADRRRAAGEDCPLLGIPWPSRISSVSKGCPVPAARGSWRAMCPLSAPP